MNAAAKGKKHAMELLEGLYRELAILGVVAFVLWSINVSDSVSIEVRRDVILYLHLLRSRVSEGGLTQLEGKTEVDYGITHAKRSRDLGGKCD